MRRARVIGSVALAAGVAALPVAIASAHPVAPRAVFMANGIAHGPASCVTPESVTIDHTQYHPGGIGTNGTQLAVQIGAATRLIGAHGHAMACAGIKTGDRLVVTWYQKKGTTFDATKPAARIVDLGPRLEHFWISGVAAANAACALPGAGVTLNHTYFHPKGIGTNNTTNAVVFGAKTRYVGRLGHVRSCAGVKKGDVVRVFWTQVYGTPFSLTNAANKVQILGHRGHRPI
jgi:hypothetical protein